MLTIIGVDMCGTVYSIFNCDVSGSAFVSYRKFYKFSRSIDKHPAVLGVYLVNIW